MTKYYIRYLIFYLWIRTAPWLWYVCRHNLAPSLFLIRFQLNPSPLRFKQQVSPHWKHLTRTESVYKRLCERLYLNQSKRRREGSEALRPRSLDTYYFKLGPKNWDVLRHQKDHDDDRSHLSQLQQFPCYQFARARHGSGHQVHRVSYPMNPLVCSISSHGPRCISSNPDWYQLNLCML